MDQIHSSKLKPKNYADPWWKYAGLLTLALFLYSGALAQSSVSGIVSDMNGDALVGVTVTVRGTTTGVLTGDKGDYSVNVSSGDAILAFSFIGYETQEIPVNGRSTINVSLVSQDLLVDEVVITAFGLARDKKAITYAAQNVNSQEMKEARPLNVVNGLSGKVAGISIGRTGGGVGAPSKVILRGNRSISGSSQPLYIVDGVPMGQDISNLSPDDIESITVLKGANAAALYGARANNGVIVVTTKSGLGGEGFSVDLNTTYMASSPIYLNNFQNEYGQGSGGVFSEGAERSWGPKLDGGTVPHWSNNPNWPASTSQYIGHPTNKTTDFFQTGHNFATNLAVSTNSANSHNYFSYTFTDAEGIVPGNALQTHNINVRNNTKVFDRLTIDSKVNYIRTDLDYELANGGGYENPIRALYKMPTNIATADVSQYEFVDDEGLVKQHFWRPNQNQPSNAYWALNNLENESLNERVIAMGSLKYEFTSSLSLLARASIDRFNRHRTDRWHTDSYIIADRGFYRTNDWRGFEFNTDFLLNYDKSFGDVLSVNASFGGNIRRNESRRITGNSAGRDSPLNVPNLFSFANSSNITASESFLAKEVQSLYGFATFGWKGAVFLDVSGRNDWSSTLKPDNWSYFYPSAGLTVVVSDLLEATPSWLSFLKARVNYAQVGNDTDPYQTARAANILPGGTGGFLQLSTTIPIDNLLPEETTSLEGGLDLRLFDNRVGLDLTLYQSNSTNQLFAVFVPVASGASNVFLNGADIENKGLEAVINVTPLRSNDLTWDITFNFARNVSTVLSIAEGFDQLNIGGANFLRQFRLIEGRPWGDVYSRGFARDDQGRVIIEEDGTPRVTSGLDVQVSNFNPDWLGGIRNTFRFKDLSLSFLIDIRQGGTVVSNTNAIMFADGQTEETLEGREGGLIFGQNFFPNEEAVQADGTPNDVATNAEAMWNKLGGRNAPVGEAFISDASNVRMREVVLGYSLPSSVLNNGPIKTMKVSFVGRNLFFFSNAAGNLDPEIFISTGRNAEGTESFGPPTMREYGLNLNIGF